MLEYRDSALQSWLPPKSTRMAAQGETNEKRVILGRDVRCLLCFYVEVHVCSLLLMFFVWGFGGIMRQTASLNVWFRYR